MAVYVVATLDTKGAEADFVRRRLAELGLPTVLVDAGSLGTPTVTAEITRETVFQAAGQLLAEVARAGDRGQAVTHAATGVARVIREAYAAGTLSGVLALGGSAGTTIGTAAMRALPLGVPKLMISTLASGQVRPYVGDKDIVMLNSVVDIAGLNRISRPILLEGAAALAGMVRFRHDVADSHDRPLIAATMFGVTTPCVQQARKLLEQAGFEVVVFHATGNGGQAMESLLEDGVFAGVLDLTTTELADELVGGVLSAGPDRLTAAGRRGIPQVVSVGALDMVNFGPRDTVPAAFQDRRFHIHNSTVTLMRTTVAECTRLGEIIGRKLQAARGPVSVLLPKRGLSAIDQEGQPFHDPAARQALYDSLRRHAGSVEVVEVEAHINDPEFAALAARKMCELVASLPRPA